MSDRTDRAPSPEPAGRHEELSRLLERALDLPGESRRAFVAEQCGSDPATCRELQALLDAHERAGPFLDRLATRLVTPLSAALAGQVDDAHVAEDLESLKARLAGGYRLEREIGGGGMSRVFVAEDLRLGRRVVVKVLSPAALPAAREADFRREIALAARLQHPYIVPLLASESVDGLLYYTMPWVAGESLRERLTASGALDVTEAIGLWRDLVDAVSHAHASGVIHRDIKPGNILLSGRHAMVTDFGIARAIESAASPEDAAGVLIGTPSYMAPEQLTDAEGGGPAVDLYQAGLVMYEMLAGRLPFPADTPRETLQARLVGEPLPLQRTEAPDSLRALVMRCIERDPAKRPSSAESLLAAIDEQARLLVARREAPASRESRTTAKVAAAIALFALAGFVAYERRAGSAPDAAPALADRQPASLGVLTFATAADDTAGQAIVDGLTQELAAIVRRRSGLHVVVETPVEGAGCRDSARRVADAAALARSLQVSHLLDGRIRRRGERLEVDVRLMDARAGSMTWSRRLERPFADVFAMQDEIAASVVTRLPGSGRAAAPRSARPRRTANAAAYEWYLRGMDVALIRSADGRRRGAEYFGRAIASDPGFSSAHAGLSNMYFLLSGGASRTIDKNLRARSLAAAQRAVALDPLDPEAQLALGRYHLFTNDLAAAESRIRQAIELDPQVPRGHESLARLLMTKGRPAEQLAAARVGLENEPLSHSAVREYALALAMNGRCEQSLGRLEDMKQLSPPAQVAGVVRGLCFLSLRRWDEAITEFEWSTRHGAGSAPAFLGFALARAGRRQEAEAILADLLAGRRVSNGAFGVAMVHAGLGDFDRAFAWLEKSIDEDTARVYLLHPAFADLQRDPRFARIRQRLS